MIEITFTESAGGSLQYAKTLNGKFEGAIGVFISCDDGAQPTQEEITDAEQEAREQMRRRFENARAVEGSPRDVFCFSLGLSMGDISGEILGKARQDFMQSMVLIDDPQFDLVEQAIMEQCRESIPRMLDKAKAGEPVRIWYSDMPDEFCGMCWLMSLLDDNMDIRIVKLPAYFVTGEKTVVRYTGWGEVAPEEWSNFVGLEKPVTPILRRMFTGIWRQMVQENAPLRTVLNGKPVSVPEDFYDCFVHAEVEKMGVTFREAIVVGNVLGRYQLGISDWWIHKRIQAMVDQGILAVAESCGPGNPIYHQMLKKV